MSRKGLGISLDPLGGVMKLTDKQRRRIELREKMKAENPEGFLARLNSTNALRKKWKEEHPEEYKSEKLKRRKKYNEWRENNPKEFLEARDRWKNTALIRVYGITLVDYKKKLEEQRNGCAICGKLNPDGRDLCVDHNHETNEVRGLLCQHCNRAIGLLGDTVENLQRALDYLKKYEKE